MKSAIRNIISRLIKPIATKVGYVKSIEQAQSPSQKSDLLDTFFSTLRQMKFEPKHIVDVGANHGTWTRKTLQFFPNAKYTLIEPQNWLKPSFQDLLDSNNNITYLPVGAGKESGSFKFTIVNRDDSCSFRFSEEEAAERGFKQIDIPVITLNELFDVSSDNLIPDIVKIDAEGLDLEVLDGAKHLFGKTEVFMVEAAIVSKNIDNSILKMINYMDQNGYRLFDITDLNRPFNTSVLWLAELVFVMKNGKLDSFQKPND